MLGNLTPRREVPVMLASDGRRSLTSGIDIGSFPRWRQHNRRGSASRLSRKAFSCSWSDDLAATVEGDFLAYVKIFGRKFVPVPYDMLAVTCILDDFRSRHSNDTAGALADAGHGLPLLGQRSSHFLR